MSLAHPRGAHPSPGVLGLIIWAYLVSILGVVGIVLGRAERRRGVADGELGMYLNGIIWSVALIMLVLGSC
jgi:hypothetical protein